MEDSAIVALYWDRDERAIPVTSDKYGAYCGTIAANILGNAQDVDECVNDTWLGAWNAMPPHKPARLATFLGKITRNLAINRCRYNSAQKRSADLREILEELDGCTDPDPQIRLEQKELTAALNGFLEKLPEKKRALFLYRYWYAEPVTVIARRCRMTQGAVTMQLRRLRQQLRTHLEGRGIAL